MSQGRDGKCRGVALEKLTQGDLTEQRVQWKSKACCVVLGKAEAKRIASSKAPRLSMKQ